jgi:hypothetical protein
LAGTPCIDQPNRDISHFVLVFDSIFILENLFRILKADAVFLLVQPVFVLIPFKLRIKVVSCWLLIAGALPGRTSILVSCIRANIGEIPLQILLCGVMRLLKLTLKPHPRQPLHNPHRLHTYIDDAEQQIQDIPRIAYLRRPVVGVVFDAAFFVGADLVALHDPFDGALCVPEIGIIRIERFDFFCFSSFRFFCLCRTADCAKTQS